MKPRLMVLLSLMVLIPLGLLVWSGVGMARREQERVRRTFDEVLAGRLSDINGDLGKLVSRVERDLARLTGLASYEPAALRELVRRERLARQFFVLGPDGRLLYPSAEWGLLTEREKNFLMRSAALWVDGETFYRTGGESGASGRSAGWRSWFWGRGLNFIYWQRQETGHVVGIEVERAVLMSDLIGRLPDSSDAQPASRRERTVLRDARGIPIYQWGGYEPAPDEPPRVTQALAPPLDAWSLATYVPPREGGATLGRSAFFNVLAGLLAVGLALLAVAFVFYRESVREIREASQKVSFVNQVSHELKTPLTNIRMYAELLAERLPEDDPKARDYVAVLVSESRRLGRLIGNVLTFAKGHRNAVRLAPAPGVIDDTIASVLDTFRPALTAKQVQVAFTAEAAGVVAFDADVLEQILSNLFSNVEKYAVGGRFLGVRSRREGSVTSITVSDRGPGIPRDQRHAVFQPFVRLSNKLSDGVSGAGIGLTIARELARLHGGDLAMDDAGPGAGFTVRLATPPVAPPARGPS